jgi:hypothetical protein
MDFRNRQFDYNAQRDTMQDQRAQESAGAAAGRQREAQMTAADKANATKGAALLLSVMQVAPERRAAAYQQARQIGRSMGLRVDGLPQDYPGDDAAGMIYSQLSGSAMERPDVGKDPIAALRARAAEAGLVPGTPQYSDFMMQGGAPKPQQNRAVYGPDGNLVYSEGSGQELPKMTEGQSKDVGFVVRAEGAAPVIDALENVMASGVQRALSGAPGGNYLVSNDFQRGKQAATEWITAVLRKDSGAVVGDDEQASYDMLYIPQPGDGNPVVTQKRAARERAVAAMRGGLGPAEIVAQEIQRQLADMPASPAGTPEGDTPEGTVIENQNTGERLVLRGGQWVAP